MIAGTMIDGHILLSDWLLLIAAIVFVIAAVLARLPYTPAPAAPEAPARRRYPVGWAEVACLGLALFALGFWVL